MNEMDKKKKIDILMKVGGFIFIPSLILIPFVEEQLKIFFTLLMMLGSFMIVFAGILITEKTHWLDRERKEL